MSVSALYLLFEIVQLTKADIHGLRKDGVAYFTGDRWGETDTRFTYCAVSALSLLQDLPSLDAPLSASSASSETPLDGESSRPTTIKEGIVRWLAQCRNFDGGYGMTPAAETHAAQGPSLSSLVLAVVVTHRRRSMDKPGDACYSGSVTYCRW